MQQRRPSDRAARPSGASAETVARPGVQVISRAAAVLRALAGAQDGVSLATLATRVGLARSTVQRIVSALEAERLVEVRTRGAGVRVRLGAGLAQLAASLPPDPVRLARPVMERLSQALGETVDLSQRVGESAAFLDQVVGRQRLQAVSSVGEAFPLHCTANGKALLSMLSDAEVRTLLKGPLKALTARTLTDVERVLVQVRECRSCDVAFDLEEHTQGICALGVAVRDKAGLPLALSIPVPTARFESRRAELTTAILAARAELSARLG